MFDGKFIVTLIALVLAVMAISNLKSEKVDSKENFGFGTNPSGTWKRERMIAASPEAAMKNQFVSVPGNYQAILSPRMSAGLDYGANIRYNMPSYENQAVPCEPLTFGNMAKENYNHNMHMTQQHMGSGMPLSHTPEGKNGMPHESMHNMGHGMQATVENYGCGSCGGGCGAVGCGKGGAPMAFHGGAPLMSADYASGNYNEVISQAPQSSYPEATDMIPVGNMTTVNQYGETIQPIIYDRFIYANRNSRLRAQGDPIRGDLAIVPCAAEWFRPSVHPNIDLQTGAMSVMGGIDNETTRAMAELIEATSGDMTVAGVNMASTKTMQTGSALADIHVTAFP